MLKNVVHPDRLHVVIWHMRTACQITKATNKHSEYVILIAFPWQLRFHKRASMLRYTYTVFLFYSFTGLFNKDAILVTISRYP